jgi:Mu-like prophage I protein
MLILVSASIANALPSGVPGEIVYLPEGKHDITPTVNGKAQRITVHVPAEKGVAIAAAFQASLAERQKQNVRPWFDFEHKAGKASAIPLSFRYEAGKGIMASVEWTGAGKEALEGKDFSYLSPTFLVDSDGIPSGLPERGPLAALVNEPAFREIPRIAASDAENITEPTPIMSKLIFAALAINAAADNAETEAVQAIDRLKVEAKEAKDKLALIETQNRSLIEAAETATKERHTSLIEAAVAAGKIAPKDEDTKGQVLQFLQANEALGVKFIDGLPVKFAAFETPLVNASEAKGKGDAGQRIQAAQGKARQELGNDADFQLVWARAAEIDPEAFN